MKQRQAPPAQTTPYPKASSGDSGLSTKVAQARATLQEFVATPKTYSLQSDDQYVRKFILNNHDEAQTKEIVQNMQRHKIKMICCCMVVGCAIGPFIKLVEG